MGDKLLKEAHSFTASDFDTIMAPVKKALGHFGKTVSASAKLIGNDVGSMIKMHLRFTTPAMAKQKKIMDDWKSNRGKHMKTIYENQTAALEGLGPDKYTAMLMCPSVFWTSAAYRGTGAILSEETRGLIGEYGADKLPLIGGLFDGAGERSYGRSLWDDLINNDEEVWSEEGADEMLRAWNSFVERNKSYGIGGLALKDSGSTRQQGTLSKLLYKINSIFLLQLDHRIRESEILKEGSEEKKKELKGTMEKAEDFFGRLCKEQLRDAYSSERLEYLEEHKKVYEPIVNSVEAIFEMNTGLAKADDPDEFFKIIENVVSKEKELQDIDPAKLKEEFSKMVEKLSSDESVLETLRKDLEKSGELKDIPSGETGLELSEKEKPIFEEKLKKIALDNCKGSFLQALKEGMLDLYDDTVSRVADGLQEETMEDLANSGDDIAIDYINQIKEFHERLENAMSNIK